ncbi:hypothetical protein EDB83DRAFT_2521136 [Lactarius deliciosus]|nr:hypothetical protein EDB83DRAFT_2521136 [Lactarius deliciosus]
MRADHLLASAIGFFVDVWFILAYSSADVGKFHLFLALSSPLPLFTLFVLVTFEKVMGTCYRLSLKIHLSKEERSALHRLIVRLKPFTHPAVVATSQTAYRDRFFHYCSRTRHPQRPIYTLTRAAITPTHTSASFTSHPHTHGLSLILYAPPDYKVAYLYIRVGWQGSLGRPGTRYRTALTGWSVGVVAWMLFSILGEYEHGSRAAVVRARVALQSSLARFCPGFRELRSPHRTHHYPGTTSSAAGAKSFFALLTLLVLLIATGLVIVKPGSSSSIARNQKKRVRRKPDAGIPRITVLSMLLVLLLVASLVPWQVAFPDCWSIHLVTCPTHVPPPPDDTPPPPLACSRSHSPSPDLRSGVRYLPPIPPVPEQRDAELLTSLTGPKTHELTEYLRIHSEGGLRLGVNLEFAGELDEEGYSFTECPSLSGSMPVDLSEEQLDIHYQIGSHELSARASSHARTLELLQSPVEFRVVS